MLPARLILGHFFNLNFDFNKFNLNDTTQTRLPARYSAGGVCLAVAWTRAQELPKGPNARHIRGLALVGEELLHLRLLHAQLVRKLERPRLRKREVRNDIARDSNARVSFRSQVRLR